jgi:glycosyltransferase 2 family protein
MPFMERKDIVRIIVAIGVAVMGLYLALQGVNFKDVGQALRHANWAWIVVAELLVLVTLVVRAQRWRIFLGRKLSLHETFGLIGIGYLVSGVVPLRAGDPARAIVASLRGPVSAMGALSTVVVERTLDMLIIVMILLATLPFVPGLQIYLTTGQAGGGLSFRLLLGLSGGLSLGVLLALVLMALFPRQIEVFARRTLTFLHIPNPERWLRPVQNVLEGLAVLRSPAEGIRIVLWSLVLWVASAAYFIAALQAFRVSFPTGSLYSHDFTVPLMGTVAMWASAFGMVFPAPGGIGSFHYAVRQALVLGFGLSEDIAFTYAVVVHALSYLLSIGVGAGTLLLWGLSFKQLIDRGQEPE